ncbi:hypothetical protein L226DRAFT_530785, partial [Lentinus tigrinus ALCF2SS1-7]|uniref:uncharacterized protein n=1 Tax=Lentinus tigrinus ALCF2SS1-7 TaxID=1328758 RepID=UPI001165DDC6
MAEHSVLGLSFLLTSGVLARCGNGDGVCSRPFSLLAAFMLPRSVPLAPEDSSPAPARDVRHAWSCSRTAPPRS